MDPYEARKIYVKLADKILKGIPGPHLATMDTWPKWSAKKSPPVPGGLYPNPKYRPEPLLPPTNGEDPVYVSLSHGPTLLSQRISGLPGEATTIVGSGSSFQTPVELVKHLAITGGDSYSHKSDNRYWSRCWFFAWSWCRCAQKVAIMVIQQATEGRANQRNI